MNDLQKQSKKIFLSFRFTGENFQDLKEILTDVKSELEAKKFNVFCSFDLEEYFQQEKMGLEEIYSYCIKEQKTCDCIIALIKSEESSKGMEMELSKAIEFQQKIILLIKSDLDFPHFRTSAHQIIEFDEISQLSQKLKNSTLQ